MCLRTSHNLNTGTNSPRFIFAPCCQWANLKTGLIPMSQITSFHTTLFGQIQVGAKQFASEEGRK